MTVFLAFLYYMAFVSLIGLARQGAMPVGPAVWTPNFVFAAFGAGAADRSRTPRRPRPPGAWPAAASQALCGGRFEIARKPSPRRRASAGRAGRLPLLPQILDTYILSTFLFYFALLLFSFVMMTHVFTFFELLGDIVKNRIPMTRVAAYLFFLTPKLIYDSTPISVLVAVLVTFGVMSKNNEVTAFKATGVSLHRLSAAGADRQLRVQRRPVRLRLLPILPEANRRQDAIRAEIKGRAPQTYLRPDRKWILRPGSAHLLLQVLSTRSQAVMVGVNVYELDREALPAHEATSRPSARSGNPALKAWVFENGWRRDIRGPRRRRGSTFQAATFPELDGAAGLLPEGSDPGQADEFPQLDAYIAELRQSGFDTVQLQVQLQKKFSVPMFAFIMALISVPFAFLTGNKGAMAGVGVSLGIAVAYWAIGQFFEQFGNVNQLPAALAAWSPDALFALAGHVPDGTHAHLARPMFIPAYAKPPAPPLPAPRSDLPASPAPPGLDSCTTPTYPARSRRAA